MKIPEFVNMSKVVQKAYEIAAKAHEGATDKAGTPYIMHPLTVAESLVDYGEYYVAAGLLHDVIEDTDVTIEDLEQILPKEVTEALKLLTHSIRTHTHEEYIESYRAYVRKIKESGNDIALKVKIADLTNNMDITRIKNPTEKDYRRIEEKYKPAMEYLLE